MPSKRNATPQACGRCSPSVPLGFSFTIALQPIVRLSDRSIYSHEALVRGPAGEPAADVLRQVSKTNEHRFDQACRIKAIEIAGRLGLTGYLNINFLPTAVHHPESCLQGTLQAAERVGFPVERIIFEFVETHQASSKAHLNDILDSYRDLGFKTAIDDFGACYSGLNLLADMHPDYLKLDIGLVRTIDQDPRRQAIVRGLAGICHDLGIELIAEGIETAEELTACAALGIDLYQGFWFARPQLEALPELNPGCFAPLD